MATRKDSPSDTDVNRLIHFQDFERVDDAIAREKQIKGWTRAKKEALIASGNPRFLDLAVSMLGFDPK